jgi:5-methylcytosine-specific restriction endonuclease McrA
VAVDAPSNNPLSRLGHPVSRAELKAMVRREQWSRIGVLYGFVPRYTTYRGTRHFDWLSCSPQFMAAFFPPAQPLLVKSPRIPKPPSERRSTPKQRTAMHSAQHGLCHYCALPTPMENFTLDHVIPRSRGGPNTLANKVGACRACNSAKADMNLQEFVATPYLTDARRRALGWDGVTIEPLKFKRSGHKRGVYFG